MAWAQNLIKAIIAKVLMFGNQISLANWKLVFVKLGIYILLTNN